MFYIMSPNFLYEEAEDCKCLLWDSCKVGSVFDWCEPKLNLSYLLLT
jgi:hypothetical protein